MVSLSVLLYSQPALYSHLFVLGYILHISLLNKVIDTFYLTSAPILDCNLRLGEGSGALTALAVLDQAVALHNHMATFSDAAVPNKDI